MIWTLISTKLWMVLVLQFQIFTLAVLLAKTSSLLKYNMFWRVHFFSKSIHEMDIKFDKNTWQKVVFIFLQVKHVIGGVPYYLEIPPYGSLIFYWWGLPFFCKACLYTYREDTIHYRKLSDFKYQHDPVKDVLFDIFRRTRVFVKKEVHVNFLTDPHEGRSTTRPTNILVYGWIWGKHASVDLIEISPLGIWGLKVLL